MKKLNSKKIWGWLSGSLKDDKPIRKIERTIPKSTVDPEKTIIKKEDIPKREKANRPSKDYEKDFIKIFENLTNSHSPWKVWNDFVIMFASSISNSFDKGNFERREKRYLDIIRSYSKEDQVLFPELAAQIILALEDNPEQDFLGAIFMRLNLGQHRKGQVFTPYHVSQLMSDIALDNVYEIVRDKGYITINDPCCGAGSTLIAAINNVKDSLSKYKMNYQNHILVTGQDIDETAALMCYIQLSLLGVSGYIKVGNTLLNPMSENDSTEDYWFTPMYYSDIWSMRRAFTAVEKVIEDGTD